MKRNRRDLALTWRRRALSLLVMLGVMLCASPALAKTPEVSGYDSFYSTQVDDGSVDILTVSGAEGQTIYINLAKGRRVIASHLAFTLDGENAETDANGDMVGVVSVNFNGTSFSADDEYTIEVFADREETKPLYAGTVSTLFGRFDGAEVTPLALRTLAEGEKRAFEVPQALEHNGLTYNLVASDPMEDGGRQVYDYEVATEIPDSVTAHVSYYDVENADSDPIKVDEIRLALNESQNVAIESIVSADDGGLYRTLQLSDSLTVSYPGTTEYAVMCKRLSDDWGKVGSFFTAIIRYVDTEGNSLGVSDKVIVNKKYTYTAPTNIYVDDNGKVAAYKLSANSNAVITLNPGDATGTAQYDAVYERLSDEEERTWTIVLENGSVSPADPSRVMGRITLKGAPGETVAFDATKDATDYVNYDEYVPAEASARTFEHTFGVADMDVEQPVYFVPAGYVAPEAYDITVNYINIATNEVITTQVYTATPGMRADLEIESPQTFSANGIEWIRLDGQEQPIRHGFYSPARTYTVYYRDVNDDLHRRTVIRTVRVEYKDVEGNTITRPTTVRNNGTTVTDGGTTDEGTTDEGVTDLGTTQTQGTSGTEANNNNDTATDTGLQTGASLRSIDDGQSTTLVDDSGTDTATVRIDDDATPLAGPGSDGGKQGEADAETRAMAPIVIAVGAGVALALFVVYKRRKKNDDDSSNDGAAE